MDIETIQIATRMYVEEVRTGEGGFLTLVQAFVDPECIAGLLKQEAQIQNGAV